MIRIKLVSKPQALSIEQGEQLVELHRNYLDHQRDLLQDVRRGPEVVITTKLLLDNNVIACAFDSGDNIVGYILFRNLTGALSIRCIYVTPAARQKGIMTAMLDVIHQKEAYHKISVNLPPKSDAVAAYLDDAGYPKARDINCGWACYDRIYAEASRRPLSDRPAISEELRTVA